MISNLTNLKSKSKTQRHCPECGSTSIARSQRTSLAEKSIGILNIYPYRCQHHICKHRFYSFGRI